MADTYHDPVGQICRAPAPGRRTDALSGEVNYTLSLPGQTEQDAISLLDGIGGATAGTGRAMRRVGIDAPRVRAEYKEAVETLAHQIAERLEAGETKEQVAKWAVDQRRQIVQRMRAGSGPVAQTVYEVRDFRKYGSGGRTYSNMSRYYQNRGVPQSQIPDRLIDGARRSNTGVNAAVRGASYLRHGGRVLIVVGVAVSAARIWNASEAEMPRVIGEELGGFIGGGLGAGAGVGICLVFGIATSGWGLLACGVIGGGVGGYGGSKLGGAAADGIFYTDASTPDHMMEDIVIEIPSDQVYAAPPPQMCWPQP